jgi:hypothetical protein
MGRLVGRFNSQAVIAGRKAVGCDEWQRECVRFGLITMERDLPAKTLLLGDRLTKTIAGSGSLLFRNASQPIPRYASLPRQRLHSARERVIGGLLRRHRCIRQIGFFGVLLPIPRIRDALSHSRVTRFTQCPW